MARSLKVSDVILLRSQLFFLGSGDLMKDWEHCMIYCFSIVSIGADNRFYCLDSASGRLAIMK